MKDYKPHLVSWNLTRRCNLRCVHCYLDASARASDQDELTTAEGRDFIDQLANFCPGAMLVFTGGEPLLRSDLNELIAYAAQNGLLPVLGTNGLLLTAERVQNLTESGLAAVGISLDSVDPQQHDDFRGMQGAWRKTVSGIEACQQQGLAVQIHTTATRANHKKIDQLIAFAADHNAVAFHLFFLVCTGRGQQMTDITPAEYSVALSALVAAQGEYQGQMLIRARCAPHFRRLAYSRNTELAASSAGCMAGTSYCRISPVGEITPCPYLPLSVGNLRNDSLADIWETAPIFNQLRQPILTGRCGVCEFGALCGGCRARAYSVNDDIMAEDPWCDYQHGEVENIPLAPIPSLEWTPEARTRLERVPSALRPMVEKGVESYARSQDLMIITPGLMAEMRAKSARMGSFRRLGFPDSQPAKTEE